MNEHENTERDEKEERFQVVASQKLMRGMRAEVTDLRVMVKEVRDALKGSDLAKDGGIVGRVEYLEKAIEKIQTQLSTEEQNQKDVTKVMRWVWISLGVVATTLFTWALNHFFPPYKK